MNTERAARIFKWWMRANRKVAFYEEESRQKQKAIDPWNVKHVNHPDNIGSEDWCKWNQWSMRSEILRAKLENRPANHWYNCAISNDECERRNTLARERFDAKQLKASALAQNDYFASLVALARVSADKAMKKYPQPNYVLLKVAEEAGEVVQASVHYAENRMEWKQVEGEIVQLLAMLIRLVTEGDQINGITPPSSCAAGIPFTIKE